MNLLEIETTTADKVTINPIHIISIETYRYKENTTLITMPGVKYFIPGKPVDFINRILSIPGLCNG